MAAADRVVVAGLVNLETTLRVAGFPLDYRPVEYPFFGVNSRVAGVGYNLSKALQTLGSSVNFCTLLGQDWVGEEALRRLGELGLSGEFAVRQGPANPQAVILYEPGGRRSIHTDLKDWQERSYPAEVFERALRGAGLAALANINFARALLPLARARGVPVATDVHVIADPEDAYNRDFMAAAAILFMSHERLPEAPERWLRRLAGLYGNRVLVVGLGAEGALLHVPDEGIMERIPAVRARPVVNTVGAGDALFAAFLHFHGRGLHPRAALGRAVAFAAHKVGSDGAAEGFLGEAELEALLASLAP